MVQCLQLPHVPGCIHCGQEHLCYPLACLHAALPLSCWRGQGCLCRAFMTLLATGSEGSRGYLQSACLTSATLPCFLVVKSGDMGCHRITCGIEGNAPPSAPWPTILSDAGLQATHCQSLQKGSRSCAGAHGLPPPRSEFEGRLDNSDRCAPCWLASYQASLHLLWARLAPMQSMYLSEAVWVTGKGDERRLTSARKCRG